jgi:hypothetical protein
MMNKFDEALKKRDQQPEEKTDIVADLDEKKDNNVVLVVENDEKEAGEKSEDVKDGDKAYEYPSDKAIQEADDFVKKILTPKPKKDAMRSINYYVKSKTVEDIKKITKKLGRDSDSSLVREILEEFVARYYKK